LFLGKSIGIGRLKAGEGFSSLSPRQGENHEPKSSAQGPHPGKREYAEKYDQNAGGVIDEIVLDFLEGAGQGF
jgi:hypothetical protein